MIIPLREKIGNYDAGDSTAQALEIIPLREKIGNYDTVAFAIASFLIIPLREKIGNYDHSHEKGVQVILYHYERKLGTTTSNYCGFVF